VEEGLRESFSGRYFFGGLRGNEASSIASFKDSYAIKGYVKTVVAKVETILKNHQQSGSLLVGMRGLMKSRLASCHQKVKTLTCLMLEQATSRRCWCQCWIWYCWQQSNGHQKKDYIKMLF